MNGPKAIETVHNGYRFRSRLEARWAIFFETNGIAYDYEKEGYKLESGWYLPDFWLTEQETWVEIKPVKPSEIEVDLMAELSEDTGFSGLILSGNPWPNQYTILNAQQYKSNLGDMEYGESIGDEEDAHMMREMMSAEQFMQLATCRRCSGLCQVHDSFGWGEFGKHTCGENNDRWPTRFPESAYHAARQARFEHNASSPRSRRR